LGVRLPGLRVRGTQLLDAELGEPLAHVDGSLKRLALHNAGYEATSERVAVNVSGDLGWKRCDLPGAVGIIDRLLADGMYGVLLDLAVDHGDGWVGALCENDGPAPLAVLLGQLDDLFGNLLDVL